MSDLKYIPSKLMRLRKDKGLSEHQFGMTIGTNGEQIKRWELTEGCCMPSARSLLKICNKHGVEIGYFFGRNNVRKQNKQGK